MSKNPDDREYSEDGGQIREVLIHAHYLSQKDIEICAAFDPGQTHLPGPSRTLATLRGTLHPKLLSGELSRAGGTAERAENQSKNT